MSDRSHFRNPNDCCQLLNIMQTTHNSHTQCLHRVHKTSHSRTHMSRKGCHVVPFLTHRNMSGQTLMGGYQQYVSVFQKKNLYVKNKK